MPGPVEEGEKGISREKSKRDESSASEANKREKEDVSRCFYQKAGFWRGMRGVLSRRIQLEDEKEGREKGGEGARKAQLREENVHNMRYR